MTDAVATRSAVELADAVRTGAVSSRDLLATFVDRIERLGTPINAVVTFDLDRARDAAARADDALARGDVRGPLHGLPVTIKDAIATAGIRSTGGAVELKDHVPAEDAPAVARLKQAGAVVFGKTNLPRWSGDLQSFNEMFGTTNNPWATDRVPGGSSGGAAAATACGFTSFELGTDIGGSVRVPSHFCGVFGLKPSYGVIPQRGYLDHVGAGVNDADINVFGPIARSAEDLDLLLGVLAGPPPEQAPAWRLEPPPARGAALADYRIGAWFDEPACPVASDYRGVLQATADRLADAGAKISEAHPPVDFADQVGLFHQLISPAISISFDGAVGESLGGNHRHWLLAQERRAALQRTWAEWFESYDLLLCPVTPTAAFPHDQEGDFFSRTISVDGADRPYVENVSWTGLIGVVGLPSAVPPLRRTAGGLPVGVQVVAPFLRDRDAVRAAGVIAEVAGGYEPPPGF